MRESEREGPIASGSPTEIRSWSGPWIYGKIYPVADRRVLRWVSMNQLFIIHRGGE